MRTHTPALIISAILAASAVAAHADTYNFVISTGSTSTTPGAIFDVSGTLTGTPDPTIPGAIVLSDITGSGQGYTFTGVVPLGANSTIPYDNVLYTGSNATHVDSQGDLLYLSSAAGTSLAHVYDDNGYYVDVYDPNDPGDTTPFSLATSLSVHTFALTPAAVPEPSTWVLLGTGILGLAAVAKRKLFQA